MLSASIYLCFGLALAAQARRRIANSLGID
jgi:hypothetical protein